MEMKFKGAYPKCFESLTQYHEWKKASRISYPRFGPCTDCTPEFQDKMKEEFRCEHPQIKFKVVEDGVEGFLSASGNDQGRDEAARAKPRRSGAVVKVYGYDGKTRTWFLKPPKDENPGEPTDGK